METLTHQFVDYIAKVAGLPAVWGTAVSRRLPQYLNQQYDLREIVIGKHHFWGVLLKDASDFRPVAFVKHLRQLIPAETALDGYCLVAEGLPGYTRRRLVERQIPFVVPDQQIFWPALGVAAQALKATRRTPQVDVCTPAAQAVLIYALNGHVKTPTTPKVLAKELGYAGMSMTRALDELEALGLGRITRDGRERLLDFPEDKRTLWDAASPFLRSPVRKTVRIREGQLSANLCLMAGETALAELSMLAPPKEPSYALSREDWKRLADQVELVPIEDVGTCRIQLWRYDPALFTQTGCVDPFSLYLSLRDETDERVESALEEMMERMKWS